MSFPVLDPESRLNVRLLKVRKPETWLERIKTIPKKKLQARVACIVFWDFFGNKKVANRWSQLDDLIRAEQDYKISALEIARGLVRVGYTAAHAATRMKVKLEEVA